MSYNLCGVNLWEICRSSRPAPLNRFLASDSVITLYGKNDKYDAASVSHEAVCICHLDLIVCVSISPPSSLWLEI